MAFGNSGGMQGTGGTASSGSDGLPRMPPATRPRRLSGVGGGMKSALNKAKLGSDRRHTEPQAPAATFRKPEHSTFPKHTRPVFQPSTSAKNVDVHDPMRWTSAFLDHTRNAFDAPVVFSGLDRDMLAAQFEGGGSARPITAPQDHYYIHSGHDTARGSSRGGRPPSSGGRRPHSADMGRGHRFPAGAYPAHGGPYEGWQGTRGFFARSRPPLPWERGRHAALEGGIQLPAPWRPEA